MDEVGGVLRTVSRVDRESICAAAAAAGDDDDDDDRVKRGTSDADWPCSVRLDVAVQPMNYFHIFKVCVSTYHRSSHLI